jgi:hypothetical protein
MLTQNPTAKHILKSTPRAVDLTVLMALSSITVEQTKATKKNQSTNASNYWITSLATQTQKPDFTHLTWY